MAMIKFAAEILPEVGQAAPTGNGLSVRQLFKAFFPPDFQRVTDAMAAELELLQEIRCRVNQPVLLYSGNQQEIVLGEGARAFCLSRKKMDYIVQRINQCSVYAWEEEYRRGYLTLPGGHRVGLVGKTLLEHGEIRTMKNISSLNFRVAREVKGAADGILPLLIADQQVCNTLIVAPPGCGKTTLLRDLVRQISDGVPPLLATGLTVGVVDERSELAGTVDGEPQLDLGRRTDVLDGCPKAAGMSMLIRSMAPRVLVTDEIGTRADVLALEEALNAGITVIASIHGQDWSDLTRRPQFAQLLKEGFFEKIIFLSRRQGVGTIERVINGRAMGVDFFGG